MIIGVGNTQTDANKKATYILWGSFGLIALITVGMAMAANKDWD